MKLRAWHALAVVMLLAVGCGSGSSSVVTIHGPIGQCVSKDLPIVIVGTRICQSRTETSLTIVYPAMTSVARSRGTCRQYCPITIPSSPS